MIRRPPGSTRTETPFPYTTLFRSRRAGGKAIEFERQAGGAGRELAHHLRHLVVDARMRCKIGGNIGTEHADIGHLPSVRRVAAGVPMLDLDRKSTRLNSSH